MVDDSPSELVLYKMDSTECYDVALPTMIASRSSFAYARYIVPRLNTVVVNNVLRSKLPMLDIRTYA